MGIAMFLRRKSPKHAMVLGCGPAGIFATHAFIQAGWDVSIYSNKRQSDLYGAQYLLETIPGLTESKTGVLYQLRGTWEVSTQKVYGLSALPAVPWETYVSGRTDAWDIRAAYIDGYERYSDLIMDVRIDQTFLRSEVGNPSFRRLFGAVVSTIPAPAMCAQPLRHAFQSTKLWASGDAPERGLYCPISCSPDTVIVNGTWDQAWYRVSNVFGHTTAEWPHDRRPPISNLAEVDRPMGTNCDCWPEITRAGRYGAWNKSEFSHHAYLAAKGLTER